MDKNETITVWGYFICFIIMSAILCNMYYQKGYVEGALWGYNNCTTEFGLYNRYAPNVYDPYNNAVDNDFVESFNYTGENNTVINFRNSCVLSCHIGCKNDCVISCFNRNPTSPLHGLP